MFKASFRDDDLGGDPNKVIFDFPKVFRGSVIYIRLSCPG